MAFTATATLPWSTPDRTKSLNDQDKTHIAKGVYTGGELAPVPGNLEVTCTDFEAKSYDGMTVRVTGGPHTFTVADGVDNHIVLEARHNEGGPPTLTFQVLTAAQYAAHGQLLYLILIGRVDLTAGGPHIEVTNSDIHYDTRDMLDIRGRLEFRGMVANAAAITALTTTPNFLRVGDVWGQASPLAYFMWNGSQFVPLGYADRVLIAHQYEVDAEERRRVMFSGVLGRSYPNNFDDNEDFPIWPVDQATGARVASSSYLAMSGLCAIVNGHFVRLANDPLQVGVDLSAIPVLSDIWDGLLLEVWREPITVPENPGAEEFRVSSVPAISASMANLHSANEELAAEPRSLLAETDAISASVADNGLHRIKYRIAVYQDITGGSAAPDLVQPVTNFVGLLNVDGNPWERVTDYGPGPGDPQPDVESVHRAVHASSSDGYSWGLPLAFIRRVKTEVNPDEIHDGNRADDGMRQIFPVAPLVRPDQTERQVRWLETNADIITDYDEAAYLGFKAWQDHSFCPSGILVGSRASFDQGVGSDALQVPEMEISMLGQRFRIPQSDVNLSAAPVINYRRDLVILEMRIVRFPSNTEVPSGHGERVASYLTDANGNLFRVAVDYKVTDVGGAMDVESAMGIAGYSDMGTVFTDGEIIDPGLWQKAFGADLEFEQPFSGSLRYALPIALVHRRNSTDYNPSTNQNGSYNGGAGNRPDQREANLIYQEDVLDLRQQVILDRGRMDQILQESYDALLQGRLRTKMSQHPTRGSSVAGVQHLHQDAISWEDAGAGVSGTDWPAGFETVCVKGGGVSGAKAIWSHADQTQPMHIYIENVLVAGTAYDLGGYNRTSAKRHVVVNVSALGVAQVDVIAPSGAVFGLEYDGGISVQPYVRMWEFTGPNTAKVSHAAVNFNVPGGLANVQAFSFDMPDAFKTSASPRMIEFILVYKGLGPTLTNLVEVNRGLTACPDVMLEANQRITDRATELVNTDLSHDPKPPMRGYKVNVSGAGNDEFDFDLTLSDPGGEGPLAVGVDIFRGGTGDYRTGYAGQHQSQRERPTLSVFSEKSQPNRINPDGVGNTLFDVAPGSRVTCNDAMTTVRVRTKIPIPGGEGRIYMPHRNSTDKTRWVETDRGGQSLLGNFVWGIWDVVTAGNTYIISPAQFTDAGGNALSPQSMFWHACAPMIDVFIWRRDGGGGNEEWELVPDRTKEGGTIWSIVTTDNIGAPGFIELSFSAVGQDGYLIGGGGHELRVIARILEPPIYDNHWDANQTASAFDKTVHEDVSYLGTPYMGVAQTSNHINRTFFGDVVAVNDYVTITSAGRVSHLRDLENGSVAAAAVTHPITLQHDAAYSFINPADVFQAQLGTFNFDEYPAGYGAMMAQLPVVEEFLKGGTTGFIPIDNPATELYYRLLKHLWGPLLEIEGLGEGVVFNLPVTPMGSTFGSNLSRLRPGDRLVDLFPGGNLAADQIVDFYLSPITFVSTHSRGVFIPNLGEFTPDTRMIKGGIVNLGVRGIAELREMISRRGIDYDYVSLENQQLPAKVAPVNCELKALADNWRHVIIGDESQSSGLTGMTSMSAYAYLLNGTGPLQTDRSNLMMIVTTRLANTQLNGNLVQGSGETSREGRNPGEAFDAFYPIGRPILRFRGE